jgi:hypothetical protein
MKPLHVRLAAWGTVLVLALIAATVRVGADEVYEGVNGPQLNGTTSQGRAFWLVAADGRVREVRMVWRFRCEGGMRVEPLGMTARDTGAGFDQLDGGRFRFADRRHLAGRDGDGAEVDVRIEGDARRGTSSAEIRLADATCRSGPVRWTTRG